MRKLTEDTMRYRVTGHSFPFFLKNQSFLELETSAPVYNPALLYFSTNVLEFFAQIRDALVVERR